jgi:hypothetical protein
MDSGRGKVNRPRISLVAARINGRLLKISNEKISEKKGKM